VAKGDSFFSTFIIMGTKKRELTTRAKSCSKIPRKKHRQVQLLKNKSRKNANANLEEINKRLTSGFSKPFLGKPEEKSCQFDPSTQSVPHISR